MTGMSPQQAHDYLTEIGWYRGAPFRTLDAETQAKVSEACNLLDRIGCPFEGVQPPPPEPAPEEMPPPKPRSKRTRKAKE